MLCLIAGIITFNLFLSCDAQSWYTVFFVNSSLQTASNWRKQMNHKSIMNLLSTMRKNTASSHVTTAYFMSNAASSYQSLLPGLNHKNITLVSTQQITESNRTQSASPNYTPSSAQHHYLQVVTVITYKPKNISVITYRKKNLHRTHLISYCFL